MKDKITYLDILDDKPVLLTKSDYLLDEIKIIKSDTVLDTINIIDLYKNKYNKYEIEKQQLVIFSKLHETIDEVKEILVLLSDNKLSMEIDNNIFEQIFNEQIFLKEHNFDQFCTNIGTTLSNYYNSSDFDRVGTTLSNLNKETKIKKMLFLYLLEVNSVGLNDEIIKIGCVHIDVAMNHFLNIFCLLMKIEKILFLFFSHLLNDLKVFDRNINNFFLQFEFLILFDLFIHSSVYNYSKDNKLYDLDYTIENYPYLCRESSVYIFNICFKNVGLLNTFSSIKDCIFIALENDFYDVLNVKKKTIPYFLEYLCDQYLDSYFVLENETQYGFLYSDCIVDFNYILCMVESLKYSYYRVPFFLDNFIAKNVT